MENFPPLVDINNSPTPSQSDQNLSSTSNIPTVLEIATLRKDMDEFKATIHEEVQNMTDKSIKAVLFEIHQEMSTM
eukprot:12340821-Ditylum_brightwellii.AAC.1